MEVYLYTREECEACETAHTFLIANGYEVQEVRVDNPLLELGIKLLFRDGQLHTPVIVIPDKGIYVMSQDAEPQLLRIVSLEKEASSVT